MSQARLHLRRIEPRDDSAMASIIRTVMPEFGASGEGFAIADPEVDFMSRAYDRPGAIYYVVEDASGRVVGGGGIAPLDGGEASVCELRKMYFLPEARGHRMGERMLLRCLSAAYGFGYRECYLETLTGMDRAMRLYERLGFRRICGARGATGHHGCDTFYLRPLGPADADAEEEAGVGG